MKQITTLDASNIKEKLSTNARPQNLLNSHFILVRQSDVVTQGMMQTNLPLRLTEQRIMSVIAGTAEYRIAFFDHTLNKGDILLFPADTVIEVMSYSNDYAVEVLAIINLPGIDYDAAKSIFPLEEIHLPLTDDDHLRMQEYFKLIDHQMKRADCSEEAISFMVLAMVADIVNLRKLLVMHKASHGKLSRSEDIMRQFAALLRQYGTTQRNIPFYASKLALTPNHLSDVVRQQSGLSVMDWLNRTTITEAKVLLKHTNLMIYEISDRLNFPEPTAFNRYFKKHVGVSPMKYRQ